MRLFSNALAPGLSKFHRHDDASKVVLADDKADYNGLI